MMKFFYSPGACSLASHIILEELQLPYEAIRIDLRSGQNKAAEFLAVNPNGVVPALTLKDGSVLTENIAILLYLAEQKPEADLVPAAGTLARARCYEWLSFINSDLHKAFVPLFRPERFAISEQGKQEVVEQARKKVIEVISLTEAKLSGKAFALGEKFSICDAYLWVVFQWAKHLKFDISLWPSYAQLVERLAARPAVQSALTKEGLLTR